MMKSSTLHFLTFAWITFCPAGIARAAHDPTRHHGIHEAAQPHSIRIRPGLQERSSLTTGQGKYTFRHRPIDLPPAMAEHLVHAHGGFAQDKKEEGGDGDSYFSLKGVGLLKLRSDLSQIDVLGGDESLASANLHNTSLFRAAGEAFLALPSDEAQKAFLTGLDGKILRTFDNPYGDAGEAFRVCDLEYANGVLFAVNGYADNVCFTTDPLHGSALDPSRGVWNEFRFGGSGTKHGLFGTAHGITRVPGVDVLTVADRANARIESFTLEGQYIGGIKLPEGAMPCDVDFHGSLALVGCLKGPEGSTPAPIYILENGNIVAELNIGRDLGLEGFTHIHNAAFHVVKEGDRETLYVLAYAWNPGNFAVLEPALP